MTALTAHDIGHTWYGGACCQDCCRVAVGTAVDLSGDVGLMSVLGSGSGHGDPVDVETAALYYPLQ